MALSIGVIRHGSAWKTCMVEQGRVVEQCAFEDASRALTYLKQTCAQYPELTLALSLECETPFLPISSSTFQQWEALLNFPSHDWTVQDESAYLIAIKDINLHSYLVPSPRYLPGIASYRKLQRADLGSSNDVCAVAALLYRLKEREAVWPEMKFLCVQVNRRLKSIQVLEDGYIINSMSSEMVLSPHDEQMSGEYEQALWEGLTRDIGGLMAVHHIEDIVVLGDYQDAFIDHFAESYQVYLFPSSDAVMPGFESAHGAAILAEGLYLPGLAAEIVERLQILEACTALPPGPS
ncbi:MAG: hypothetical protein NVS3B14_10350 [Ktedonobacteraceae bacterium]